MHLNSHFLNCYNNNDVKWTKTQSYIKFTYNQPIGKGEGPRMTNALAILLASSWGPPLVENIYQRLFVDMELD